MATPRDTNPLTFIQQTISSPKFKRNLTLTDITEVLKSQKDIVRMNDRGLFIVLMSELINYQFILFGVRMRTFYSQICPPVKVIRKKREEDEERVHKRTRKARVNVAHIDLKEQASKAISNSSNLSNIPQATRLQQQQRQNQSSQGNNSQNAPRPTIEVDFDQQLQKIQQIQGNQHLTEGIIQQHSSQTVSNNTSGSSSTASSSGLIPNLEQKLRLLGGDVSFQGKRTVPRRRLGAAGATVRRRDATIVDTSIYLNQTKAKIELSEIPQRLLQDKRRAYDIKRETIQFEKQIISLAEKVKDKLYSSQNLRRLKDFHKISKHGIQAQQSYAEPFMDFQASRTQFQTSLTLPQSAFINGHEDSDFNRITMEHFDSTFFRQEKATTLDKLVQRTRRPKEQIFMKTLWMAQRGEVAISQQNPELFGEIFISMIIR